MQKVQYERAYKVVKVENEEESVLPFVIIGPRATTERMPPPNDDRIAERWTGDTNLAEDQSFDFFGHLVYSDGDVFVFNDVLAGLEGSPRTYRFETLTWKRLADVPLASKEELKKAAPTDDLLNNFFVQNYLDTEGYPESSGSMWSESTDKLGPVFMSLAALLEGKGPGKKGYPIGTIRKWSDGYSYEKMSDGMWKRVPGQGGDNKSGGEEPPTSAFPADFTADEVLPPDEDGWREFAPWIALKTTMAHFIPPKHGTGIGKPTPERKKLHDHIVARMMAGKTPADKNHAPVALVTIGVPATGKSSMVTHLMDNDSGLPTKDEFVRCDPDLIKIQLPEYKEALQAKAKNAADIVHEESTYVNDRIFDAALKGRYNLVFDGLGRDTDYYKSHVIDNLKTKGYHVVLLMPFLPSVEEAKERATRRGRKEGRWVHHEIIESTFPLLPKNFRKLAPTAHEFALYSTEGSTPEIVWAGNNVSGEADVFDEERYAKFLSMSEAVAKWLSKLMTMTEGAKVALPALPPAIPIEEAIQRGFLDPIERTEEAYARMPDRYTPDRGVRWPVEEATAKTIGQES